jgi:hypothetical protein
LKELADDLIKAVMDLTLDLGVEVDDAYYNVLVLNEAGLEGQGENDFF